MKRILTSLIVGLPLILVTSPALAADEAKKPYPLDTCVVSGEKLGEMGDPYLFTHEGQEIKLCCKDCLKKFNKDPDKYLKKLHEAGDKPASGSHDGHDH